MSEENNFDEDVELPSDVLQRVNVGIVAVSLSLYEEGMDFDELIEVTGIREDDVIKCLDYLIQHRMVRKKINTNIYHVSNFKKMLQFLLSSGLMFPIGDQITRSKDEK